MKKIIFSFLPFLLLMACNQGTKTENTNTDTTAASGNSNSASDTATDRVTGPMPGTVMTKDYVYYMGRQMYFWGWPLVNLHNRILVMQQVPEAGLNGGAVPVAPLGHLSMLADYITPDQRYVACPNQDVVYGSCFMLLDSGPVVLQVPDFGDRFWVIQMGNQRTNITGTR